VESNLVQREELVGRELMQERIVGMVQTKAYRKVNELISDLQEFYKDDDYSVERIKEIIQTLEREGRIRLSEPKVEGSFPSYLTKNYLSNLQLWFGLSAIALSLLSTFLLSGSTSFSIVKIVAGGSMTFVVLGYALVGIMYPRRTELSLIQRTGFGIMLSLVIIPILWVAMTTLNPEMQDESVVLAISGLAILLLLGSAYRRFSIRKNRA